MKKKKYFVPRAAGFVHPDQLYSKRNRDPRYTNTIRRWNGDGVCT